MRDNGPITDREYELSDGEAIITRTDTYGRITYANSAFYSVSGFTPEEVIGAPQNIVRHPHMPTEAFADLWRNIKAGNPWTGLVKNRCKSGDYYWVLANVTPVIEGGEVTGYMSVRIKPARTDVEAAERAYRMFREGRANGYAIDQGCVVRTGVLGWLRRFTELPFAVRTWMALGAVAMLFGVTGVAGWTAAAGTLAGALIGGASATGGLIALIAAWYLAAKVGSPLDRARSTGQAIASGDLTRRIEVCGDPAIGEFLRTVNQLNGKFLGILLDVRGSADAVALAAAEIASGNSDLSRRTESQAASLQQTAASMEQLAGTVRQNAENARQANQVSASASDVAVQGGQVVRQVVDTMGSISASSNRISEIIGTIDGIAFQTNILALNAAVEAARAGEQGRGFAVVASEVRALAQRSAAAAKEIKDLIRDSAACVEAGGRQVDQAGATMEDVVAAVKRVTDIMTEITAASDEQSQGIDQVTQAVGSMDDVTQQNAALVEQAAAAAESLKDQAVRMSQAVSVFKVAGPTGAPSRGAAARPVRDSGSDAVLPARTSDKTATRKPMLVRNARTGTAG